MRVEKKLEPMRFFRQPDGAPLGMFKSHISVEVNITSCRGSYEWDIPAMDHMQAGSLVFEPCSSGALELVDFDGAHSLPRPVFDLLREAGYIVGEEFM